MSDASKINPLLQLTKTEILERQLLAKENFADCTILTALEAYGSQSSPKRRAQEFMNELLPLWSKYQKGTYVDVFKDFVEIEFSLEAYETGYTTHATHVIQEFLFGYNVLLNCPYFLETFEYDKGKKAPYSKFGRLFFSWMAAALFHDVGYDIEKAYEEESFRKKKNEYWSFMSKRAVTDNPISLSEVGPARNLIEEYIFRQIKEIPCIQDCSYNEFEAAFRNKVKDTGWVKYDHGLISALKYLVELKAHGNDTEYLDWEPNKQAALAMAVHNARYKPIDLRLSSTNPLTIIAYLLTVSDEVQEWERERLDTDEKLSGQLIAKKDAKKETRLVGISFKPTHAYIAIDHKLKDPRVRDDFEEYLFEKILLQKRHLPIEAIFSETKTDKPILLSKKPGKIITSGILDTSIFFSSDKKELNHVNLADFDPNAISIVLPMIAQGIDQRKRLKETNTEKKLLQPANPTIYTVYVDHRIDGKPFIVTIFPF
jgi:hypothetical protein